MGLATALGLGVGEVGRGTLVLPCTRSERVVIILYLLPSLAACSSPLPTIVVASSVAAAVVVAIVAIVTPF